jgi:hypothetical protein
MSMNASSASKYKTHILVFGLLMSVYGIFGWLDVGNYAQGGWATDPNNTVTQVLAGSPSEAGGLQVGDVIASLGGISVLDSKALSRRARPKVGETWEFVVERDGAEMSLDITFGEPVAQRKFLSISGFIIGFCFIGFTLRAFMQQQTESTLALAMAGIMFSLVFIGGPYFENYTLRSLNDALASIVVFLGVAAILNFLLVHLRSGSDKKIFIPGLAVGLFIAYRILATPESTDALNTFSNIFIGVVAGFYMIASLVTVYRSYSGATASEKDSQGLNLMLIGALVGFLPPIISVLVGVVSPQTVLPGQNFYFLSMVAIPITWSMAVLKAPAAAE